MAQPTPYTRQYDLENDASDNPLQPIPGAHLDQEFDAVKVTLDKTLENLALIQRDDGALTNGIVTVATLSADVKALMAAGEQIEGPWLTATAYGVGDVVSQSSLAYFCLVAHTSGTFATDLAAGKWQQLTGTSIADGSVTTAKLAADAVTTAKILDANVTAAKIASDAVTTAKILDANVTAAKLASNAVTTAKITDANVTNAKLASVAGFSLKGQLLGASAAAPVDMTQGQALAGLMSWTMPGQRLSLTTAVDVTVSDVTAAGTIYWTPSRHNVAPIFDGTTWTLSALGELTFVLDSTNHLSGKNHDVYLDYNSGTPRLLLSPAWTDDTTRADALGRDATYKFRCNNATITCRISNNGGTISKAAGSLLYLGTIRCAANGQSEDSAAKRFVWNMYNRVPRFCRNAAETTDTWSYNTATIRQANANTANQLDFVRGLDEDAVEAFAQARYTNDTVGQGGYTLIGLDSTTAMATGCQATSSFMITANQVLTGQATWRGLPGVGRHYLTWLERGTGTGTQTWSGDGASPTYVQSGITGTVMA